MAGTWPADWPELRSVSPAWCSPGSGPESTWPEINRKVSCKIDVVAILRHRARPGRLAAGTCWSGSRARRDQLCGGVGMDRRPGTPSLLRELNDRAALELLLTGGPLTRAQLGEH